MTRFREALAEAVPAGGDVDTVFGLITDTEHRAEVLALLGVVRVPGMAYCLAHDEPDVEGYDPPGDCRLYPDGCTESLLYRTDGAQQ